VCCVGVEIDAGNSCAFCSYTQRVWRQSSSRGARVNSIDNGGELSRLQNVGTVMVDWTGDWLSPRVAAFWNLG